MAASAGDGLGGWSEANGSFRRASRLACPLRAEVARRYDLNANMGSPRALAQSDNSQKRADVQVCRERLLATWRIAIARSNMCGGRRLYFVRPPACLCRKWRDARASADLRSGAGKRYAEQVVKALLRDRTRKLGRALDSGAKRNEVMRSGFEHPFQARQARLGMAS